MTPQICVDNTFELQHRVTILSHTQDGCYKFIWNRNLLLFFFSFLFLLGLAVPLKAEDALSQAG